MKHLEEIIGQEPMAPLVHVVIEVGYDKLAAVLLAVKRGRQINRGQIRFCGQVVPVRTTEARWVSVRLISVRFINTRTASGSKPAAFLFSSTKYWKVLSPGWAKFRISYWRGDACASAVSLSSTRLSNTSSSL